MKHLCVSLAIIAMLVSPAYAWGPWDSDIEAVQEQVDEIKVWIGDATNESILMRSILPLAYAHGGEADTDNQVIDWVHTSKVLIDINGPQTLEFTNLVPGDELVIWMQNHTDNWQPIFWPDGIEWENHYASESPPGNEMKIFRLMCGPYNKIYGVVPWNRHPWK